ncbi:hypothetical protein [Streptomyces sp. NPDC002054]|uniref:hypothetical protein n=1 Tax=Streptomyces sp. NPDC002054 TaxID=3154663 RepID=UPI00331F6081
MHGPGYPPPHHQEHRPNSGFLVTMRVLFALLPLLSCGMLAFGTLIRLAVVTRRTRDWVLCGTNAVLSVCCLWLLGTDPTPDASTWRGNTGMGVMLAMAAAIVAYFLYADIKHHANLANPQPVPPAGWYPPTPPPGPTQYGYPPAAQTQPQGPGPTPPPAPPAPRIGQVRAELDELSELLRKQDGREQGR